MAITLEDAEAQLNSQWTSLSPDNPASPFFVPPPGTYQNDAGQVVSTSTPNTPVVSTPSTTTTASTQSALDQALQFLTDGAPSGSSTTPAASPSNSNKTFFGISLEDIVFVILGIVLIGAGLFAFKTTQNVVNVAAKAAKTASELTA